MTTKQAIAAPQAGPLADIIREYRKTGVPILGYIVWFSVPDRLVELRKLRKAWIMAALDPKVLPPEPRPLYIFKRAMRAQGGKVRHTDGSVTETDVRLVLEDGDYCIYQISRVVKDAQKRVVEYPKAMRVVFFKADSKLDFQPLKETPLKDLLPMQQDIETYYDANAKYVEGRKVRAVVREFIKGDNDRADQPDGTVGLSGESLRGKGGGVYFVPARHQEALESLAQALDDLHPDGSAYLSAVPLPDGTGARELVRQRHVNNTVKELEEASADAMALLREDRKQAIRADHAAFHFRKLASLRRRAAEYAQILKDEDADVQAKIEFAEKQLQKLPGAVAA